MRRCGWANSSELMKKYHDEIWGVPVHDDQTLFEMLILEGKSCGLSWELIWKKREGIKKAFDDFKPETLATYDKEKIDNLTKNPAVIRNRLKIEAVVSNAKAYLELKKSVRSFSDFLRRYTEFETETNDEVHQGVKNTLSDKLSTDLKKLGFKFVGSTIVYSFMQAVGIINDHEIGCFMCKNLSSSL